MSDTIEPQVPEQPIISEQEKTMGMLAHLLGLIGIIGPLIIYLIKKDESAFVKEQTLESLNFQITVLIAWFASILLLAVHIGGFLFPIIGLGNLILVIMATVAAKDGVRYKYPINLRLIK